MEEFHSFFFGVKAGMPVAGVNEDGMLGFPTDAPVSELPVLRLCLTFDS